MPAKYIKLNNGQQTQIIETHANTVGELFTDEFREDFNISSTGRPTVNNVAVPNDTPLHSNVTVGFMNGASSKS